MKFNIVIFCILTAVFAALFIGGCGEAPTDPMDLIANAVSATEIELTWSPSEDNAGVITYGVYRNGLLFYYAPETTKTDSGLQPDTEYCYTITAFDEAWNESGHSTETCTTTLPDTTPPSVPATLIANAVSATEIDLSWDPSTDDVAVTGYNIYRDGAFTNSVTGAGHNDVGLSPATEYCYAVTAIDAAANESEQSEEACASTLSE